MVEIILPENKQKWLELRTKDITSTEVSALFGLSPYMTKFELWHRKKRGDVVELSENKRMFWGTKLQDAIAGAIAEKQGWNVRRMDEYIRDPELRAGSSFDFSINEDGLLEIKNVDGLQYKEKWNIDDEGNIEAPLHIEMQVQHQLMVSGREYAYIGALIGGNDEKLIPRKRDEIVISEIRKAIKEFWKSVEENKPPEPDFTADSKFIAKLYGFAEPNKIYDARGDERLQELTEKYKEYSDTEKQAKQGKDAIKAEILTIIGDAEKVTGDKFTISAGVVAEAEISYTRQAYRMFKTSWRKK